MKSTATKRFWSLLETLPQDIQELAEKNYQLWRDNPQHPSSISSVLLAAGIASPFVWETIIELLAKKRRTKEWNGYGLVPMRSTTDC